MRFFMLDRVLARGEVVLGGLQDSTATVGVVCLWKINPTQLFNKTWSLDIVFVQKGWSLSLNYWLNVFLSINEEFGSNPCCAGSSWGIIHLLREAHRLDTPRAFWQGLRALISLLLSGNWRSFLKRVWRLWLLFKGTIPENAVCRSKPEIGLVMAGWFLAPQYCWLTLWSFCCCCWGFHGAAQRNTKVSMSNSFLSSPTSLWTMFQYQTSRKWAHPTRTASLGPSGTFWARKQFLDFQSKNYKAWFCTNYRLFIYVNN